MRRRRKLTMSLTSKIRSRVIWLALAFAFPGVLGAQENSLAVTVTPPLFQLTIGPGETWRSEIKIVNNNSFDVTYYASPVNFASEGESGAGRFLPLIDENTVEGQTLGEWISVPKDPIVVKRGSSGTVPFSVTIPENAAPGGHYAAILVGTQPEIMTSTGPSMKVSSYVTSLLFVRIKGEVEEKGRIREFRSEKSFVQDPKANFVLRFENIGNTHLAPRGEAVLYNMWGKERGKVEINRASGFGNVLPDTTRSFSFSWKGEASLFEIGRYSAHVTLSYGDEMKQTVNARTYFWVVPVVPVSITLGTSLLFIVLFAWLIRRYIRRALALERERYGIPMPQQSPALETLMAPIQQGAVDLRGVQRGTASVHTAPGTVVQPLSWFHFLQEYSLFFFFCALVVAAGFGMWMYFDSVLTPERSYEITSVSSEASQGVSDPN